MSIATSAQTRGPTRQSAVAAAEELTWLSRYVILAIVCVGVFMNTLDSGIVDVLNPVFVAQYHLQLSQEYWIELAYAIPLIGMLLPAGHLGDRFGRKTVFLGGMVLFGSGSGLLTLMPTFETMFAARVVQGVGAACISANGGVLAVSVFPWKQRGQVLGIIGTAVALGLKMGPLAGGVLADNFGWRSAFLVNVVLGIIFVLIGTAVLPASKRITGRKFDVWSPAFFMAAVACFLLLVNQGPTWGWSDARFVWVTLGFLVSGAAFVWVATHVSDPTIDLSLYRSRNFTVAVVAAFISFVALTPVNQLIPFYMEDVQGLHVSETGLIFITTTLAIALTQPFSGRLADRIGSRPVASTGLLMQGFGLLALCLIPLNMNPDWLVPELALVGFGVGLFRSPNHRALFGSVPKDKMGQAGGYQHLPRQLGESIGETGVVTLFTAVVLASASMAGVQMAAPAPTPTAVPTPAPQAGAGLKPNVVIQPYVPAARSIPPAIGAAAVSPPGAVSPASGSPVPAATTAAGASVVDTNTSDDLANIVDVPDDSSDTGNSGDLSPAVTSLPAGVQLDGYRLMWGLAGILALAGAGLSFFGRDEAEAD
ncbi:MAG: MFS transporter [Chloroflexi bacterium]|nr:MFS transporter [Chloroflexota bacterium]